MRAVSVFANKPTRLLKTNATMTVPAARMIWFPEAFPFPAFSGIKAIIPAGEGW
jgi:hypothetical protein